jgi:hypothetical protein
MVRGRCELKKEEKEQEEEHHVCKLFTQDHDSDPADYITTSCYNPSREDLKADGSC